MHPAAHAKTRCRVHCACEFFYCYNTKAEVDRLFEVMSETKRFFSV